MIVYSSIWQHPSYFLWQSDLIGDRWRNKPIDAYSKLFFQMLEYAFFDREYRTYINLEFREGCEVPEKRKADFWDGQIKKFKVFWNRSLRFPFKNLVFPRVDLNSILYHYEKCSNLNRKNWQSCIFKISEYLILIAGIYHWYSYMVTSVIPKRQFYDPNKMRYVPSSTPSDLDSRRSVVESSTRTSPTRCHIHRHQLVPKKYCKIDFRFLLRSWGLGSRSKSFLWFLS